MAALARVAAVCHLITARGWLRALMMLYRSTDDAKYRKKYKELKAKLAEVEDVGRWSRLGGCERVEDVRLTQRS